MSRCKVCGEETIVDYPQNEFGDEEAADYCPTCDHYCHDENDPAVV